MTNVEITLRDIYFNPKIGYRRENELYKEAVKQNDTVTRKDVKNFLETQKEYMKNKKYVRIKNFRKTFVSDLAEQLQVDLVIMTRYKNSNHGYQYILMAIEILSRFAFAMPLKKKDQHHIKKALEDLLEDFHDRYKKYPDKIQFDEGSEFINTSVKSLLREKDIVFFTTHSDRKASIVERLNRTIQTKIRKIFEHQGDSEWVSFLHDVVQNYNTTTNRSIRVKPIDVNEENKYTIWGRLFGEVEKVGAPPKFSVGDTVRVAKFKLLHRATKKFRDYYNTKYGRGPRTHLIQSKDNPNFSEETFTIHKILLSRPIVYQLYSREAEDTILGVFYEEELSFQR